MRAVRQTELRSVDVALAVIAITAVLVEGLFRAPADVSPAAYLLASVAGAPLLFRTRAPLAALTAIEVGAVTCAATLHASWTVTGIVAIQLHTVALLGDRQRSVVIGAVTAVAVIVAILIVDGLDPQAAATRLPLVFLSLAIGDTARSRRALRSAARERAERRSREQQEEVERRAAAERLRIAQELHDSLGHFLVAINVRASVAVDLDESEGSATALQDIKQTSAGALHELRSTLALLRDQSDGAPTAPMMDLDALPGLVRHARSAGLEVGVALDVGEVVVPSAISGAAFRIVQEALTNALRHADAGTARVSVRARSGILEVDVIDDGTGGSTAAEPGFGLRGMAERAAALGGQLDAGPGEHGGWRVHARLPLLGGAMP